MKDYKKPYIEFISLKNDIVTASGQFDNDDNIFIYDGKWGDDNTW